MGTWRTKQLLRRGPYSFHGTRNVEEQDLERLRGRPEPYWQTKTGKLCGRVVITTAPNRRHSGFGGRNLPDLVYKCHLPRGLPIRSHDECLGRASGVRAWQRNRNLRLRHGSAGSTEQVLPSCRYELCPDAMTPASPNERGSGRGGISCQAHSGYARLAASHHEP
jgi:hypothetical protein